MRARLHDDPATLLAIADPFLRSDPFSTSVIAVTANRSASGALVGDERLWITVEDSGGKVVGVAMQTPPHALFVSRMLRQAATVLATTLVEAGLDLPGVNGACDSTNAFADAWSAQTGKASTIITAIRMYRLKTLNRPWQVSGETTVATAPGDVNQVADWLAAFHDEAQPNAPREDWVSLAERRIASGQVHVWRDEDTAVALAAVSPPAHGVARVGPVYTPLPMRRRGYGAAVTSAAAAAALAGGAEHVVLYTDLANPTSNSIYQAIGFRPDHDAQECSFR
jgi:predicted GNAT family acetyltransferase